MPAQNRNQKETGSFRGREAIQAGFAVFAPQVKGRGPSGKREGGGDREQ